MVDFAKFKSVAVKVIDNFEGGYFHPDMLKDGRIKDTRYSASGETMYGIDRLKGGKINETESGKLFWQTIDKANARKNWAWNYMGGKLKPLLTDLASSMIYSLYKVYLKLYIKSPELIKLIETDERLLLHLVYATWNGAGWFKKFATDLTNGFNSGLSDQNKLYQIALFSRTREGLTKGSKPNSLIRQTGLKIERMFKSFKPALPVMLFVGIGLLLYLSIKN